MSTNNLDPTDIKPLVEALGSLEMTSPTSTPLAVEIASASTVAEANIDTEKTETQLQEVKVTSQPEDPEPAEPKPDAAHTAKQLERLNNLYESQIDLYNYIHNLDKSIHLVGRSSITTHKEKVDLLGYLSDYRGKLEDQYTARVEALWANHKARLAIFLQEGNGDLSSFLADQTEEQLLPNTVTKDSERERILKGEIPAPKFRVGQRVLLRNVIGDRKEEAKSEAEKKSEDAGKGRKEDKDNGDGKGESEGGRDAESKDDSTNDPVVGKKGPIVRGVCEADLAPRSGTHGV